MLVMYILNEQKSRFLIVKVVMQAMGNFCIHLEWKSCLYCIDEVMEMSLRLCCSSECLMMVFEASHVFSMFYVIYSLIYIHVILSAMLFLYATELMVYINFFMYAFIFFCFLSVFVWFYWERCWFTIFCLQFLDF